MLCLLTLIKVSWATFIFFFWRACLNLSSAFLMEVDWTSKSCFLHESSLASRSSFSRNTRSQ